MPLLSLASLSPHSLFRISYFFMFFTRLTVAVFSSTCGEQVMLTTPTTITNKDGKFGVSVAIGSTGGYMIVGEKGYPLKAYVYVEAGDTWSLTDTLVGPGPEKEFGKYSAVYDETIVLSHKKYNSDEGRAFVYKRISGK